MPAPSDDGAADNGCSDEGDMIRRHAGLPGTSTPSLPGIPIPLPFTPTPASPRYSNPPFTPNANMHNREDWNNCELGKFVSISVTLVGIR